MATVSYDDDEEKKKKKKREEAAAPLEIETAANVRKPVKPLYAEANREVADLAKRAGSNIGRALGAGTFDPRLAGIVSQATSRVPKSFNRPEEQTLPNYGGAEDMQSIPRIEPGGVKRTFDGNIGSINRFGTTVAGGPTALEPESVMGTEAPMIDPKPRQAQQYQTDEFGQPIPFVRPDVAAKEMRKNEIKRENFSPTSVPYGAPSPERNPLWAPESKNSQLVTQRLNAQSAAQNDRATAPLVTPGLSSWLTEDGMRVNPNSEGFIPVADNLPIDIIRGNPYGGRNAPAFTRKTARVGADGKYIEGEYAPTIFETDQAAKAVDKAGTREGTIAFMNLSPEAQAAAVALIKEKKSAAPPKSDKYKVIPTQTDELGNPLQTRVFNETTGQFVDQANQAQGQFTADQRAEATKLAAKAGMSMAEIEAYLTTNSPEEVLAVIRRMAKEAK